MKFWKASEFRAFLLYYSLPTLSKFLPDAYLQHWILFVKSIYLLLQKDINLSDLEMAETILRMFVRDIGTLYRARDYVYNVHEVLHLPLYVKRWGPLWATSAFIFEKYNGVICQLIHGTKNKGKELINNLRLAHGVEILRHRVSHFNIARTQNTHCNYQVLNKCSLKCLTVSDQDFLHVCNFVEPYVIFSRVQN